ncbi:MAG: hypothetical protein GY796_20815, partial [Chloroflexi bacterium]|nr:hypothetical protein [Chloroflexota bacterium]
MVDKNNYGLDDFDPAMVEFYKDGDQLLGLPFAVFPSFVFVNLDLFDEAGLPYPPQEYGAPSYLSRFLKIVKSRHKSRYNALKSWPKAAHCNCRMPPSSLKTATTRLPQDIYDVDAKHGAMFGAISGAVIGLLGGPIG